MSEQTPFAVRIYRPDKNGKLKLLREISGAEVGSDSWRRFRDSQKYLYREGRMPRAKQKQI